MKKWVGAMILGLVFSIVGLSAPVTITDFSLVKVIDGDTFVIDLPYDHVPELFCKKLSVRVRYLNTPELHSKVLEERLRAYAAKRKLQSIMFDPGSIVILHNVTRGKYFRILSTVFIFNLYSLYTTPFDNIPDLHRIMIDNKLGIYYLPK